MAKKTYTYCDICGKEITNASVEERYDLQIINHDKSVIYHFYDVCHTCYLDLLDEIDRKIIFYHSKHEMENSCVE